MRARVLAAVLLAVVSAACSRGKIYTATGDVREVDRANRQIVFRFEIEKGKKIGEVEVTMPNGESKTQELFNDTVIGFNKLGEEVVRVTVEEPTFERPADVHVNSI